MADQRRGLVAWAKICVITRIFKAYTEQCIILSYAAVAYYLRHRFALAKPFDPINGSHFVNGFGRHGGAADGFSSCVDNYRSNVGLARRRPYTSVAFVWTYT